jgi:hypothetical protein
MPNGNPVRFWKASSAFAFGFAVAEAVSARSCRGRQPRQSGRSDSELTALERNAQEVFRDVVARSPQLSDDLQTVVANIEPPGRWRISSPGRCRRSPPCCARSCWKPSASASVWNVDPRALQGAEVLELRNKIHEQVQEQVNQSQREFLLREQMKAIQKELGESATAAKRKSTSCARRWKSPACPPKPRRNAIAS